MERRLAAILAADVVGYSRLMGEDEAGTLERLKALRKELVQPRIMERSGRVVKLMGDGLLAEFPSVVEAVQCAVDIQQSMVGRETELPGERRIRLRIGVNLGDIIVEGSDIYGDGVNVAARLEGLADPGGICVSGTVFDHVKGKVGLDFADLGDQQIKNIDQPVRVYGIALNGGAEASKDASASTGSAAMLELPDKPSIAVLPFDNMSGDPEQEYFSDGITEDVITALAKYRWFFVIDRNSTFTYKGQTPEAKQVARELGVRYVLEGSVRKAGNRVRVAAQLVDATTGTHIWAERYDREVEDIFELQDDMTSTIVGVVEPELRAVERERAVRKPPGNLDAWEIYQRGLWHMWTFGDEELVEAIRLFQRAHELDPTFAAAYAHEAYANYVRVILAYSENPDDSLASGLAAAKKATTLDDKDPVGYFALGRVLMMMGQHDASIAQLEHSIRLNPSFSQAHHGLGFALALAGRLEEAVEASEMAIRLSPRDPLTWATMVVRSLECTLMRKHEEALEWAERTMRLPRINGYYPHAMLAAALGNLGRIDEARAAIAKALEWKADLTLSFARKNMPTKEPDGLDPYLEGLRRSGLPE
jgi:adenylate cyclase